MVESSPLMTTIDRAPAVAGDTVSVKLTLANFGEGPASGQIAVTAPDGWTAQPASADFGPIAAGASQATAFQVAVPARHRARKLPAALHRHLNLGTVRDSGTVTAIGDTIEFTPDTEAEAPWLFDADGSQLDGAIDDGHGRFADGNTHTTYRFTLPADVTGGG
jgi:hypothetical protein